MSPLAKAIDALLAFIPNSAWSPIQPRYIPLSGEIRDHFDTLDQAVWVEACLLGHEGKMPRQSDDDGDRYLGKTNVPGFENPPGSGCFQVGDLHDWRNDLLALRALVERGNTPEAKSERQLTEPKTLLTGWHAIAGALDLPHARHKEIRSLNDRCGGPITNKGAGTRPMVYQEDLIEWWNKMAVQTQELENQREGARLSVEAQHNYGRDGTAAPEIGGGVKKRRRDKRT